MRRLLPLLFAILALNVAAQTRPPKLEPIPEPPPPPPDCKTRPSNRR
jgi:hypothetical protein